MSTMTAVIPTTMTQRRFLLAFARAKLVLSVPVLDECVYTRSHYDNENYQQKNTKSFSTNFLNNNNQLVEHSSDLGRHAQRRCPHSLQSCQSVRLAHAPSVPIPCEFDWRSQYQMERVVFPCGDAESEDDTAARVENAEVTVDTPTR